MSSAGESEWEISETDDDVFCLSQTELHTLGHLGSGILTIAAINKMTNTVMIFDESTKKFVPVGKSTGETRTRLAGIGKALKDVLSSDAGASGSFFNGHEPQSVNNQSAVTDPHIPNTNQLATSRANTATPLKERATNADIDVTPEDIEEAARKLLTLVKKNPDVAKDSPLIRRLLRGLNKMLPDRSLRRERVLLGGLAGGIAGTAIGYFLAGRSQTFAVDWVRVGKVPPSGYIVVSLGLGASVVVGRLMPLLNSRR